MNLQEYVVEKKPILKDFIVEFLKNQNASLFEQEDILNRFSEFVTNGKMLRGLIICLISQMYGKDVSKESLSLAAAIEINHSSLLMHDDILDNDRLRRGKKTIFAQYEDEGRNVNINNPYFYGISSAIIVGDIGIFLAVKLFQNVSEEYLKDVLDLFYCEMVSVGLAEQYEFGVGMKDIEISDDAILDIYRYKTARYTFSLPMKLGALIAGASEEQIKLLDKIGEELGIIFQIIDDEIGLLGTEEEIGKPVGSDIRENKKTLVRKMLFEEVGEEERQKLMEAFGNHNLTQDQIKSVQEITKNFGIDKKIFEIVSSRADSLKPQIDQLEISYEHKNLLKEFVDYNLHRTA